MRAQLSIGVAAGLLIAVTPLYAHHAFNSEFDADKPVKLHGTVTKMEWINPHSWMHVEVKKPDGTTESWMIEAGTPNTLFRRGFTKESLLPGTEVVVEGFQSKDGAARANGFNVTFTNGKALFLGAGGSVGAPTDFPK